MSESWHHRSIGDCLAEEFPGEWGGLPVDGGNATVLRSTDIDDHGHVDTSGGARRTIPTEKLARKALRAGDILLEGSGGGPGKPVGRVALFEGGDCGTYICSNFFRTLRPKLDVHSHFLVWRLQLLYQQPKIWVFQQQTTGIINLRFRDYAASQLELPPLSEQLHIAEILDTIDDSIRRTEQIIAKLEQIKQGLLHDLLTRGLDDNGELRDPVRHPEQFKGSPLGRIPKTWLTMPLEQVVGEPITYGIVQAGPHIPNGIPYIRTGDMSGEQLVLDGLLKTSPQIAASYLRSRVREGEIVCAIRATVGKVLPVPPDLDGANLTQGTARISPRSEVNSQFLLWTLRGNSAQRQFSLAVKGTTFREITLGQLRLLRVPVPDPSEQERIADSMGALEERKSRELSELHKLQLLKKGLMDDLLTGRVRVTPLLDEDEEATP